MALIVTVGGVTYPVAPVTVIAVTTVPTRVAVAEV